MKFSHIFFRLLMLLPLLTGHTKAQNTSPAELAGTVEDINKNPVSGMSISVQEGGIETITDEQGEIQNPGR